MIECFEISYRNQVEKEFFFLFCKYNIYNESERQLHKNLSIGGITYARLKFVSTETTHKWNQLIIHACIILLFLSDFNGKQHPTKKVAR